MWTVYCEYYYNSQWNVLTSGPGSITVTVSPDASSDATLSNLSLSSGTLEPTFASATETYTASVAHSVSSVTVAGTANDDGATVSISPADADSGTDGHQVSLSAGSNTIRATVTAEDTATTRTYTVTVTRADPPTAPGVPTALDLAPSSTRIEVSWTVSGRVTAAAPSRATT